MGWSLESAIDTADSMRSRGYGCAKRTSFQRYAMTGTDWLLLALEIALPVLVLAFGDAEAAYTPDLYIAPLRGLPVRGVAAYAAFLFQEFPQGGQILGSAPEPGDQGNHLPSPVPFVQGNTQSLFLLRQRIFLLRISRIILKIGIRGVHHA